MISPPPTPMPRVTKKRQEQYLEDPTKCPNCGAPFRKMGRLKRPKNRKSPDGESLRVRFEVKCSRCKFEFVEFYQLVAIAAKRK